MCHVGYHLFDVVTMTLLFVNPNCIGTICVTVGNTCVSCMTEAERRGLPALAPLAGKFPPPSDTTSGGGKSGKPITQAKI